MRDHVTLGETPRDEPCVCLGEPDYYPRAQEECARFIELIRKKLGPEPYGAHLATQSFPRDFGTSYEVICCFEESDEEARHYAYLCEVNLPRTWQDDQPIPQKQYSVTVHLRCRLTLTVADESWQMAKVRAEAHARAKAQTCGFDMDDYDEVLVESKEIKQAALAPPQS